MTDRLDSRQLDTKACRPYRRLTRFGFLVFAFVFLSGSRACDDRRPATITCQDIVLSIEPGKCASFANSCNASGRWAGRPSYDGLRLEPTEETREMFGANWPFSLHTTRNGDDTTRSICVRADSPLFASLAIDFVYGLGTQYGTASILLSVTTPLAVEVSASPTSVALGESSQLVATAQGGIRPYLYSWVPTTGLDDVDIAAPIASPVVTTEYRVRVTDSGGQEAIGRVNVSVRNELTVTATPEVMNVGDVAVLLVEAAGGTPPYDYIWTPAATLDDPYVQNPTASPVTTTTYQVIAFDALGAILSGAVTVEVRLALSASAEPQNLLAGEISALFADVRGGLPPYTFTWTPADTLDDPWRQDPVAAPTTTTTYRVVATDSAGDRTAGETTVQIVSNAPPPTASFVMGIDCCPRITLDAGASTGRIAFYTWDLGWTSANPDQITTSPTTSFVIREFDRGPITLTVTAVDGQTATFTRIF
jgi:hypothetical protein